MAVSSPWHTSPNEPVQRTQGNDNNKFALCEQNAKRTPAGNNFLTGWIRRPEGEVLTLQVGELLCSLVELAGQAKEIVRLLTTVQGHWCKHAQVEAFAQGEPFL